MSNDREQRLQQRAYAIWEIEGRPDGRDREHWERAERELSVTPTAQQNPSGVGAAETIVESKSKKSRRAAPKSATSTASSRKKKPLELRP